MESLPSAFVFTQLSLLEKNTNALQDYNKDQIFEVTILATDEGGDYGQGPLHQHTSFFFSHSCLWDQRNQHIFNQMEPEIPRCIIRFKLYFSTILYRAKPSLKEGMQSWLDTL
jgi:hypothetical protein